MHSLLGPSTPHGETPFAAQPSQRQGFLSKSERGLNILELGHDPRDEALSPRDSNRSHKVYIDPSSGARGILRNIVADTRRPLQGPFVRSPQVAVSRMHQPGGANDHSFRPSSESEHLPFTEPEEQLWLPHDMIEYAVS